MSNPQPSMDQGLAEAKASENADKCGMFLMHNGIVRATAKAQVRQGEEMPAVNQVEFSYDAAGVEAAVAEALTWDGVYYVKVWLNEGALSVGESIMYVLIGADIRPRCIDALQNLVGKIKNELVVEKEIYVDKPTLSEEAKPPQHRPSERDAATTYRSASVTRSATRSARGLRYDCSLSSSSAFARDISSSAQKSAIWPYTSAA